MMSRLSRVCLGLVFVVGSACGGGTEDTQTGEPLGTVQAELAPLEYNVAGGNCDSFDFVTFGQDGSGQWGQGAFNKQYDSFCVMDDRSDGKRVGIHWRLGDDSRRGLCVFTGGANGSGKCDKDLPEGKRLELRIGRCDGSVSACDTPSAGWSWEPWGSTTTSP